MIKLFFAVRTFMLGILTSESLLKVFCGEYINIEKKMWGKDLTIREINITIFTAFIIGL